MTFLQFACEVFDAVTLRGEEHDEVINQVGTFVNQAFVRTVASLDYGFYGLFATFWAILFTPLLKRLVV